MYAFRGGHRAPAWLGLQIRLETFDQRTQRTCGKEDALSYAGLPNCFADPNHSANRTRAVRAALVRISAVMGNQFTTPTQSGSSTLLISSPSFT